jgi:hypothetical protein
MRFIVTLFDRALYALGWFIARRVFPGLIAAYGVFTVASVVVPTVLGTLLFIYIPIAAILILLGVPREFFEDLWRPIVGG